MNLKKCANGHFYDGDTYATCPHCAAQAGGGNETVALDAGTQSREATTVAMTASVIPEDGPTLGSAIQTVRETTSGSGAAPSMLSDDQKTVSFFAGDETLAEQDPVVGWLVSIKGKQYGHDYRLKAGRNFIGRSSAMDVALLDEMTVSRDRHAIVVYEPKQNMFLAMPGDTKELVYLNGNVVLMPTEMRKNDVLQVGEVLLMLVPFCDNEFTWNKVDELVEKL